MKGTSHGCHLMNLFMRQKDWSRIMSAREGVGVVLMTYGSPKTLADIPPYLTNVRGGRAPDNEIIAEFERRYTLIGGSPLLRITRAQAAALEKRLNERAGARFRVVAGMRYAPPFIADVLPEAAENASRIVGVIMSPQYSPIIMEGYVKAIRRGVATLGRSDLTLRVAREWHLQPDFIQALSEKVSAALSGLGTNDRRLVHVLMTAHSMPKRVIDKEPVYVEQLRETAAAVATSVGLPEDQWSFCYQSAGHTPEEWLKPDFADMMPLLRERGCRYVLISPVQFLADHLETLYDIDIAARKQAEDAGLHFARTSALNDTPRFIDALTAVVRETLTEAVPISSSLQENS